MTAHVVHETPLSVPGCREIAYLDRVLLLVTINHTICHMWIPWNLPVPVLIWFG
jgi:hypothetical protein